MYTYVSLSLFLRPGFILSFLSVELHTKEGGGALSGSFVQSRCSCTSPCEYCTIKIKLIFNSSSLRSAEVGIHYSQQVDLKVKLSQCPTTWRQGRFIELLRDRKMKGYCAPVTWVYREMKGLLYPCNMGSGLSYSER